jgi:hypothetical protein
LERPIGKSALEKTMANNQLSRKGPDVKNKLQKIFGPGRLSTNIQVGWRVWPYLGHVRVLKPNLPINPVEFGPTKQEAALHKKQPLDILVQHRKCRSVLLMTEAGDIAKRKTE